MASPSVLNFEELLAPIPGDNPAGEGVPFAVRKKLDDNRKEVNPELFAADDPMRPDQPKFADWAAIIRLAQDTLKETSKDLLVAARLTEALTKENGFGGLRDSVKLLHRLVADCWDRLNPSIEDGDLEVRAAAFNWLDDVDRGARFPQTIRTVKFLRGAKESFCWQDWRNALDNKGKVDKQALDAAINGMSYEECNAHVEDLKEAIAETDGLSDALGSKMGDVAPGMVEALRAMRECLDLAQQVLGKKAPPPGALATSAVAAAPVADNGASGSRGVQIEMMPQQARRLETREDVYAQLIEVSNRMLQLDPHSPITYLVQRAVKLSKMSLPQLMRSLIRDAASLNELNRDLDLGFDEEQSVQ